MVTIDKMISLLTGICRNNGRDRTEAEVGRSGIGGGVGSAKSPFVEIDSLGNAGNGVSNDGEGNTMPR